MHLSASVAAWIAIAAAAAAAAAVLIAIWALLKLSAARAAQRVLLSGGTQDLVDFAVSLQSRIDDLHRVVDEVSAGLARVDRRLEGSLSKTALVRYDAFQQKGGEQSATVALLDGERSGLVISAIQGRDYARIYMKELDHGRTSVALSPEELEAVERAMAH